MAGYAEQQPVLNELPSGDAYWFPIVGGAWLVAAVLAVLVALGTARKLGAALAAREGITAGDDA